MYERIFLLSLIAILQECHGKCDCGTYPYGDPSAINSRIWNGNDANKLRYPWYIHIKEYENPDPDPDSGTASGGTLISKKHVLTCAHCVKFVLQDS